MNVRQSTRPHSLSGCVLYKANAAWNRSGVKRTICTSSEDKKCSITVTACSLYFRASALPTSRRTASVMRKREPSSCPASSSARWWYWSRWLRSATTNSVSMKVVFDTLLSSEIQIQVGGEVRRGLNLDALEPGHDSV